MHLESLRIQDFRNIEEASIELKPLTIIRGHNHQGKTSVAQAIQISLTTRADGTDAAGRGANDKIRLGAKKARIELGIRAKSGLTPFAVTYGPNRTGRQVVSESPAGFLKWLDANTERLSCAVSSEYFVQQKAEDQKSILAALVLPQMFEFPEEMRKLAEDHLLGIRPTPPRFSWDARPLDIIDTLYDLAFEMRKTAKAALSANHIPKLPDQKPSTKTVDQIREVLNNLREKANRIRSERPQIDMGELQRLIDQQSEVGGKLFRAEAEQQETRTAVQDAESNILAAASLKTYERVANQRKMYDKLEEQLKVIVEQIEDQRTVQAVWRDLLKQKKCPTCTQDVTEQFVNERIAEAEETIRNQGVKQNELMRDQRELGDIQEAERLVTAHKDALGQKDTFQRRLADEVAEITRLKEEQRTLKAKIEAARGASEELKKPDPELDELDANIKKGEGILEAAIRYEAVVQQISEASERGRQLAAKVEALEKLCNYFGKDGVKAKLIQENIKAFESTVNSVLRVWGYEAELQIEPYSFIVSTPKGPLPLKELSGSERLMFGVALQTAIAHHGKIGMVVIDKADTFINSERGRLFQIVSTLIAQGFIEQAIVMVSDDRTEAPKKDGVVYYAAQGGKLVAL